MFPRIKSEASHYAQSPRNTSDCSASNKAPPPLHNSQPAGIISQPFPFYPLYTAATPSPTYRPLAIHTTECSSQNVTPAAAQGRDLIDTGPFLTTNANLRLHALRFPTPVYLDPAFGYWSPALSQRCLYEEAAWPQPDFTPAQGLFKDTSVPCDETYYHESIPSSIWNKIWVDKTVEPKSMSWNAPPTTPESSCRLFSTADGLSDSSIDDAGSAPSPHSDAQEKCNRSNRVEAKKAVEPYAQLIFRALMTRDDHTMPLQEIYKWFRENTSKADPKHPGWQNTIRHNLSMNAAFIQCGKRRQGQEDARIEGETPGRSAEWVLADWAVRDGIQSTSQYRSQKSAGHNSVSSRRFNHLYSRRTKNISGRRDMTVIGTKRAASRKKTVSN